MLNDVDLHFGHPYNRSILVDFLNVSKYIILFFALKCYGCS